MNPGSPLAPRSAGRQLICRGYEEGGSITEDQPGWTPHLVTLFTTGTNPHSPIHTPAEHLRWARDPNHSYVRDGRGGLVIWAHPYQVSAARVMELPGLAGI